MRLVLDTNIVISALLWKGTPHTLLTEIRQRPVIALYTSAKLLAELADVLSRDKLVPLVLATGLAPEALMRTYKNLTRIVMPAFIPPTSTDPDDDHVLACALAARADFVVSGDNDLLSIEDYRGIPIVGPAALLARMERDY